MTKKMLWILLAWLLTAPAWALDPQGSELALLLPQPQQAQAALWSAQILTRYHYKACLLYTSSSGT